MLNFFHKFHIFRYTLNTRIFPLNLCIGKYLLCNLIAITIGLAADACGIVSFLSLLAD